MKAKKFRNYWIRLGCKPKSKLIYFWWWWKAPTCLSHIFFHQWPLIMSSTSSSTIPSSWRWKSSPEPSGDRHLITVSVNIDVISGVVVMVVVVHIFIYSLAHRRRLHYRHGLRWNRRCLSALSVAIVSALWSSMLCLPQSRRYLHRFIW